MAATGDVLGTGVSALLAMQRALTTVGHNIANVNTEGFNRQRVDLGSRLPQVAGDGFIGQGVQVTSVRRIFNSFLSEQARTTSSTFNQLDNIYAFASQMDNLLADPQAGLAPSLQDFFNAVHDVADDPTSAPARQVMVSQGNAMATRFQFIDERFTSLYDGVESDMRSTLTEVNSLASSIAQANQDIIIAQGRAPGQPPNDLLDTRDQFISELAKLVGVTTLDEGGGVTNIFIGNGQALVVGTQFRELEVTSAGFDLSRAEITFKPPFSSGVITDFVSGGRLGGLVEFRREVLDPASNTLGRLAIGMAATFNAQHQLGLDFNGAQGGQFFNVPVPKVFPSRNNTSNTNISVSISDASVLTAADYRLTFDGTNAWTLTNLDLSQTVTLSGAGTNANPFVGDGLRFSVEGLSAGAGDSYNFLIQPTRQAAGNLSVAISDPALVAAAAPLRVTAPTANGGNGQIDLGAVTAFTSLPLSANGGAITLTFDVSTAAGTPAAVASNAVSFVGTKGTQAIDFSGLTLGNIDDGDSLIIGGNRFIVDSTGAVADNFTTRSYYVDTSAVASLDDLANAFATKINAIDASGSNTFTQNSLDTIPAAAAGVITITSAYATSTSTQIAVTGNAFDTGGVGETAGTTLTAGTGPAAGDIITLNNQDFVFNFLGSGVVTGGAQTQVTIADTAANTAAAFAAAVDPQASISAAAVGATATITADTAGSAGTVLVTDTNTVADSGISQVVTAGTDASGVLPGFTVTNGPGGTIAYNPVTESGGKTFTLATPFGAISFTLSGTPINGDTFVISDNTNGVGDNRNALLLANLQEQLTLAGSTVTYQEAYAQLVADIGSQTRETSVNRDAQSSLLDLAVEARDSVSGVNLDEEAANLLRFQQAYQAAAQLIAISNQMFDELIGVIRS